MILKAEEREDIKPVCPHCGKELELVWYRELESFLGK